MRKITSTIGVIIFLAAQVSAQQIIEVLDTAVVKKTAFPEGLRKAGFKDLDLSKPLMLDGVSTPVYTENLMLVQGNAFMEMMRSGEYIPDVYIDSAKAVRAFVLRKATELERGQMIEMKDDAGQGGNSTIGKKASSFSVTDMTGEHYSLESLKGKVVVINCWFVECKPCVMEMPDLNALADKYRDNGVVFLGFALNDKKEIGKFLEKNPFRYRLVPNAMEIVQLFGVSAFPTHIVLDPESTIVFFESGLGPQTISSLEKTIQSFVR